MYVKQFIVLTFCLSCFSGIKCLEALDDDVEIIAVTFATNNTEGLQRYLRSARYYGIEPVVLGMGHAWEGGNIVDEPGGGQKAIEFRNYLKSVKEDPNKVILFTDGYDVMFTSPLSEISRKFQRFKARIIFSAERSCWPDTKLADQYPKLQYGGYRYLNSGGIIGYAKELYDILSLSDSDDESNDLMESGIKYDDDDQLYYTNIFLNHRDKFQIKLDIHAVIFQNLYAANVDVKLSFNETTKEAYVENIEYRTLPSVIHGNGRSKIILNSLGNYLAGAWKNDTGCLECKENTFNLDSEDSFDKYPKVLLAIFVEQPTPFLEEFFQKIKKLDYPKRKLHLFVHNSVAYHAQHVETFINDAHKYASIKQITVEEAIPEREARNLALDQVITQGCDYIFVVDSIAHLDNKDTLKLLIEQNRTVLAPMLTRPGKTWSNFWGALSAEGYYARSFDYMDIVNSVKIGVWNVPYASTAYLIQARLLKDYSKSVLSYDHKDLDPDMAFCHHLTKYTNTFIHVTNRHEFGHLINADSYDVDSPTPELFHIFENKVDWEHRYISPLYAENFNLEKKALQPCPDVFWFPVTTMRFCNDLIKLVESFGQWSDGSNKDPRLTGGYEAVPTRDIHMNQVGFEKHWLYFLKEYVRPLQELVFIGYYHNPPRSLMNFVVRYRPNEQPSLRPHHDSSTYTINLALNTPNVDYEGGGCRFIRYNCSVENTKPGWLLMHPGRLTHYHEGLLVTKGTRYIMISFVDP